MWQSKFALKQTKRGDLSGAKQAMPGRISSCLTGDVCHFLQRKYQWHTMSEKWIIMIHVATTIFEYWYYQSYYGAWLINGY